jgi:hypothetical protein
MAAGDGSAHVVLRMIGMRRVQRMVSPMGMGGFAALMVMTMVVVAMLAMRMLVTVVSLAVMNVLGSILIYRCRCRGACWSSA